MNKASQYIEHYPAIEPHLPGGDLLWLQALRKKALSQFATNGFPSPR